MSVRNELQSRWDSIKIPKYINLTAQAERFMRFYVIPMFLKEYELNPKKRIELTFLDRHIGYAIRKIVNCENIIVAFGDKMLAEAARISKKQFDIDAQVVKISDEFFMYTFYIELI